ncbi:MAG TPA: hypothetical protein VH396_17850 [Chitinophagaceae bacterium]|jgi:hypothetical protein
MVVAERKNLIPVKVLISNSFIHLELFENTDGYLFLSSDSSKPVGTVYYATTPSLFCMFLEDQISLQVLFDKSPSLFVELNNENKTVLYSRKDIEIELKCGDKTIKQLTENSPMEIWQ